MGLTDAEKAADDAVDWLADAETAVLSTVPTTHAGTGALANCDVSIMEERRDEEDMIAAMRTLAACLARSA
jgi:predicted transcriptional regulator